jgi:cell division inhibitor SulA/protein ImuA
VLGRLRAQLADLERAQRRSAARGGDLAARRVEVLSTGFADLDLALGGGLRAGALNELLLATGGGTGGDAAPAVRGGLAAGVGALEAFLPALARLQTQSARHLAWIHPSRLLYPPALAQAGLDLSRLLFVRPGDAREQAWAIDLALRSGACAAVTSQLDGAAVWLEDRALRRLQLAAEEGDSLGLLVRSAVFARAPSPAAVRLELAALPSPDPARRRLRVTVLHCRGALPSSAPLTLEWSRDPLAEPAPAEPAAEPAALELALGGRRRALGA